MSIINSQPLIGASGSAGYQISRSVRIRTSASAYFNRTPGSASNRQKFTWSGWVKRGTLSTTQVLFTAGTSATDRTMLLIEPTNEFRFYSTTGGTGQGDVKTTAVFRDASAWYHVVFAVDTTQATAGNRLKIYVNGVLQALTTTTTMTLNAQLYINNTVAHTIGRESFTGSNYFDGYLTEINHIDGQQLDSSSFGETNVITGVWQPKRCLATYNTNGYYLNFSDNSNNTATTIGKDSSGNGNNYTPNNISVTAGTTYDSMLDVPTLLADGGNGRGNYPTLNPISTASVGAIPISGNLEVSQAASTSRRNNVLTITLPRTGKWYMEVNIVSATTRGFFVGLLPVDTLSTWIDSSNLYSFGRAGARVEAVSPYAFQSIVNGAVGGSIGLSEPVAGDVLQLKYDADAGTFELGKNNTFVSIASGISGDYIFTFSKDSTAGSLALGYAINCGQRPFAYTPPTGFKALNTQNLPEPTIKKGSQYFDATLWTGTGATQSIVNSGSMQPDLVWIKQRSAIRDNRLHDSVRGVNKQLYSNTTGAETSNTDELTAFNSDGFTLSTSAGVNASAGTYVGWQWKEGATQGFDIVSYTGDGASTRNISHSLGVVPSMIIIKNRSSGTGGWPVKHKNTATNTNLGLSSDAASTAFVSGYIQDLNNSSTFGVTIGSTNVLNVNANANNYIAYCFAEVPGFSKFGSYTGNGSTDGPMIFTNFKPKFVAVKRTDATGDWIVTDGARNPYNVANLFLLANSSTTEGTGNSTNVIHDFLSNGFKLRGTATNGNASGGTYIYMAFAENPFKYSLAR